MPALQRQRYLPVYVNRYDDPEGNLARAVAAAAGLDTPAGSLSETLRAAAQATDKTVILLCDQFERCSPIRLLATSSNAKRFSESGRMCKRLDPASALSPPRPGRPSIPPG